MRRKSAWNNIATNHMHFIKQEKWDRELVIFYGGKVILCKNNIFLMLVERKWIYGEILWWVLTNYQEDQGKLVKSVLTRVQNLVTWICGIPQDAHASA
jgi:hypothetical protein